MAKIEKRRRSWHVPYRVVIEKSRMGTPVVRRAYQGWAVAISRRGVAVMKRKGQMKKGGHWPIYGTFRGKHEASIAISDAVANDKWPKGWLIAIPVLVMDPLTDGIYT